jgi:hypothetical protein
MARAARSHVTVASASAEQPLDHEQKLQIAKQARQKSDTPGGFSLRRAAGHRTESSRCARAYNLPDYAAYFVRLQTTSLLVPAVVEAFVYLSSSAVRDVIVRLCVPPLRLGKDAASTFVIKVLLPSSTDHVP